MSDDRARTDVAPPAASSSPGRLAAAVLIALLTAQIGLHAAMTGLRLGGPLLLLRQGLGPWGRAEGAAGVLLACFALMPVLLALPAGRWVDRRGYHRPVRVCVGLLIGAAALAVPGAWLGGLMTGGAAAPLPVAVGQFLLLMGAATLAGTGCNVGLIAMQRTAGHLLQEAARAAGADPAARADPGELRRVFSWMGLAPAISNVIGPVLVGVLIDQLGFAAAFGAMGLLPLLTLAMMRRVPREVRAPSPAADDRAGAPGPAPAPARHSPRELLLLPGMGALLGLNGFFSSSWDLYAFLVPLLGHERGLSASAIGSVLGVFAFAVAVVRVAIPLVAGRFSERQVLGGAAVILALCFFIYPWAQGVAQMAAGALAIGLALGSVQPMIMTALHHLAPPGQEGEAIALRSSIINLSSTLLPMAFGAIGAALGPTLLFRGMALLLLVGAAPLSLRLRLPSHAEPISRGQPVQPNQR